MLSDIEIAEKAKKKPIKIIARSIGLSDYEIEPYGNYKAKLSLDILKRRSDQPDGKLILVTAITPTSSGEGKTLTTVGLGQALNRLKKKAIITLREPSLGPVFGIKGGAAGGGYSQVLPMEDINLHFTGDMHAVTAAHNLLAAVLDNHIHNKNMLNIDVNNVVWKRVMDMNERALRNIVIGLGGQKDGTPREDHFAITAASEIMAILCLSTDLMDLKRRLGEIIVAYNMEGEPVRAKDLKVEGAMALLLKDAIKPNLVQTTENTAAIIHGGPFGNIAHGTNSIIADKIALKLADYVVTEAGFGTDLGAEKFFDIVCPLAGFRPSATVLVVSIKALKRHGGVKKRDLHKKNIEALKAGLPNMEKHIENLQKYGVPVVVAINHFEFDDDEEIKIVMDRCAELGVPAAISDVYAKGGAGGKELARLVLEATEKENNFHPLYDREEPLTTKIERIATEIYGADGVHYDIKVKRRLKKYEELGYGNLAICMAKTQSSISDNPKLLGRPTGWVMSINDVTISAGAGFIVPISGEINVMPGLPKKPAAEGMDIDENGMIKGLF